MFMIIGINLIIFEMIWFALVAIYNDYSNHFIKQIDKFCGFSFSQFFIITKCIYNDDDDDDYQSTKLFSCYPSHILICNDVNKVHNNHYYYHEIIKNELRLAFFANSKG